jgi:transposase InsO family protein
MKLTYFRFNEVISDNGKEFCNKDVDQIIEEHGGKHITTRPYHPQSNGCVERVNYTIDVLLGLLNEWYKLLICCRKTSFGICLRLGFTPIRYYAIVHEYIPRNHW